MSGSNPSSLCPLPHELRAIERLLQGECGDIVLFGEFDGSEISPSTKRGRARLFRRRSGIPFLITPGGLLDPAEIIEEHENS